MATSNRRSKNTQPEEAQQAAPEIVEVQTEGEALETMEQECDEAQNPDAPEVQAEAPTHVVKERNASTVESPVKRVWAIADSMPEAKRKDVIAACVAEGIAFFTARTQYQKWKQNQAT